MAGDLEETRDLSQQLAADLEDLSSYILDLMGTIPHPVYVVNATGIIVDGNEALAQLTGWSLEELLGERHRVIFAEEATAEEVDKETVEKGYLTGKELTLLTKQGERIPVCMFTRARTDDSGNVSYVATLVDMTERGRAEQTLRESERRYRLLAENATDVIWTVDLNMRLTYISPSVTRLLGYSVEEAMAKKMEEVFTPASFEVAMKTLAEELATENMEKKDLSRSRMLELELYHKDGSIVPVEINCSLLRDPDGRAVEILVIARDISERKQAEDELRVRKSAMASSINAIALANLEGHVTYVNYSFLRLWGYDNDREVIGKPALEFWQVEEEADKVVKRLSDRGSWMGELVAKRKDGSTFDAQLSASMVTDGSGESICMMASFVDITEHKQAEEKIRHAAQEWRATFDSIADPISIQDRDFRIVRVNKAYADIFKKKPSQLIGRTCYELVHGTTKPVPKCPHSQTLETKKPAMAEFFEPRLGIYLQVSTSPMFNEKGEVVGSVHIARDITESKQMEEQLVMTDRLASIGELASGIAHELNNPLTSIIGFSQLLMDENVPDDVKEDLSVVYSEAQRAAGIVKNLLIFARKHAPVKQMSRVNSIIEDVLKLRAYEQKVSNIEVNTQFASDLPEIMVDYFQMQQAFLNIVINAESAMLDAHSRGTLTVTTKRVNNVVRASFADDGPGIAKENLSRIFAPFFTTKEVGKGTGLGLSICHGIVTEHGGRIYARSELGKGATFVVELPINGH